MTAVTLLPMKVAGLDTSAEVLPPLRVLVAYGVYFLFGWVLYRHREVLRSFGARWRSSIVGGIAASVAYLYIAVAQPFTDALTFHMAAIALAGLSIWLLIFGITGLFIRFLGSPKGLDYGYLGSPKGLDYGYLGSPKGLDYGFLGSPKGLDYGWLDKPRPVIRYLSDGSYWIYLVHVAPVIWLNGLLATSHAPALVKFAVVLGVTTLVSVLSYHYFVRSTAIGQLLNGPSSRNR